MNNGFIFMKICPLPHHQTMLETSNHNPLSQQLTFGLLKNAGPLQFSEYAFAGNTT